MSRWGGRASRRLRTRVLDVYGTTCHLCAQPIDLSLAFPDGASLSIDHIVPRSRGGSDDIANLRPAHLSCNSSRQADPMSRRRKRADERRFFE